MSLLDNLRRVARSLLPPILFSSLSKISRPKEKPRLEYAPQGETTPLTTTSKGWNAESVISMERSKWEEFCRNLEGPGPLGFSHEHDNLSVTRHVPFHNVHITYAYVLALAAQQKPELSVLDWGGGLGHYYSIGRVVLPDVDLDFHCKEVPAMVEAGKKLNPTIKWYTDDSCLARTYDLVMINGSLQYLSEWKDTLLKVAPAVGAYFLLTRVPVIDLAPSFLAIQREYGTEMMHQQFNQSELLAFVESLGLKRVREFVVGDRPYVYDAPEQCELRGWLFKRPN